MKKTFWDHSCKPSVFVEITDGIETYRGPFRDSNTGKEVNMKPDSENDTQRELAALKRDLAEAQAEIQRLRYEAQKEAEHHDRLVKELEGLYDKLKS